MMKDLLCNVCGRKLVVTDEILMEDALVITKKWGYFSGKDGETHELCICEKCYDKIIEDFKVPVTKTDTAEYM